MNKDLRPAINASLDAIVHVFTGAGHSPMDLAVHMMGYAARMVARLKVDRDVWLKSCGEIYDDHKAEIQ